MDGPLRTFRLSHRIGQGRVMGDTFLIETVCEAAWHMEARSIKTFGVSLFLLQSRGGHFFLTDCLTRSVQSRSHSNFNIYTKI